MSDEGGSTMAWLADAYTREQIVEEWDYMFDLDNSIAESYARLEEQHYAARWTTDAERADPDAIYDLFGCGEDDGIDITVYYWRVSPDWKPKNQHAQGPFLYYEIP